MLDIKLFRENPEIIKESEKKRFRDIKIVDKVIELDKKWRELDKKLSLLRRERNEYSKNVLDLTKQKKDAKKVKENVKKVKLEIEKLEPKVNEALIMRDSFRYKVGNILHNSVPTGADDKHNKEIKAWGQKPKFAFKPKGHADLIVSLDIAETEKASEIVGARFYYLKNEGVMLNLALINYAVDLLVKKGYTPYWTPFLLTKKAMSAISELSDFEKTLYKIDGEDLFLIATSEQTLGALYFNETIPEKSLPLKFMGFSTNFRREAGSHGKDTKGIFRVHQFEKIEQFVFCKPEDSWKIHEELLHNSEELMQGLGIPYRVVNICSGDMNDNAAKKYDIEAWFPEQDTYRETHSISNCTDYQARKLNTHYGTKGNITNPLVHTLNGTGLATGRIICAILENFQQKDGSVEIPKVLHKYLPENMRVIKPKK